PKPADVDSLNQHALCWRDRRLAAVAGTATDECRADTLRVEHNLAPHGELAKLSDDIRRGVQVLWFAFVIRDRSRLLLVVEQAFREGHRGTEANDFVKRAPFDLCLRSSPRDAERAGTLHVDDDCPGSKDLTTQCGCVAAKHEPFRELHVVSRTPKRV